jgi:hypothetical protein
VLGPVLVNNTLPQSTKYRTVPFRLNTTSVGLKVVVAFFKVRKSEIVLLLILTCMTFWPIMVLVEEEVVKLVHLFQSELQMLLPESQMMMIYLQMPFEYQKHEQV